MMKFLKLSAFILLGSIFMHLLNSLLIEPLIIPDLCYYHNHETTKIFDLFYELTAAEGYHPAPTKLNLIITIIIGALLGLTVGKIFTQKPQKRQHH